MMRHARTTPHLTLGVAAFSMAQRQAIQDALEQMGVQTRVMSFGAGVVMWGARGGSADGA